MKVAHLNSGDRGLASYALNIYNYFSKKTDIDTLIVSSLKWTKTPIPVFEPKSRFVGNVLPWVDHIQEVEDKLVEYKPDILHHHHPVGKLDFYVERLRKATQAPLITTVHMSVASNKYFVDKVMHELFELSKGNFRNSICYVAISQYVKRQLELIGGLPPERIVLLYAGVDPEIYKPLPYRDHDCLEVTFVGQLMLEKGIDILVDVVMKVAEKRKIHLNIVGRGHLESALRKKTEGHPEINWVGFLGHQDKVAEAYANSDLVVFPTRWEEAFSYIPIEAMASGTPVVASNTGGNTEIVQPGKTGWLFSPGSREELYDILLKADIGQCWEMGARGREYVLGHHTLDLFGSKYKSLYENVLSDPSRIRQID